MSRTLFFALALSACSPVLVDAPEGAAHAERDAIEEALIVRAANELTLEELDDEVPLDARAARNIVAERPFATVAEVDAVSYVGPDALDRLYAYAVQRWDAADSVYGYTDGTAEADAMLDLANGAGRTQLIHNVGLEEHVAAAVIAARPYAGLADLADVCSVDALVFDALAEHVAAAEDCPAGKVVSSNGMTYDDLDRAYLEAAPGTELRICAGTFSLDQLNDRVTQISGVGSDQTFVHVPGLPKHDGVTVLEGITFTYSPTHVFHTLPPRAELHDVVFENKVSIRDTDTVVVTDSVFEQGVNVFGNDDQNTALFERTVVLPDPDDGVALGIADNAVVTIRDMSLAGGQTAVRFYSNTGVLHIENVDFGIGPTDNTVADVDLYGAADDVTWLYDDVTATCIPNTCSN